MVLYDYNLIRKMQKSDDSDERYFAIYSSIGRRDIPTDILADALQDPKCANAARLAARYMKLTDQAIHMFAATGQRYPLLVALDACLNRKFLLIPVVQNAIRSGDSEILRLAFKLAAKFNLPGKFILPGMKNADHHVWTILFEEFTGQVDIDPEILIAGLVAAKYAIDAKTPTKLFLEANIPDDEVRKYVEYTHPAVHTAALRCCLIRGITIKPKANAKVYGHLGAEAKELLIELFKTGLVDVSKEQIALWARSTSVVEQTRAAACINVERYFDEKLAKHCLNSLDPTVCTLAADALQEYGAVRDFNPPKRVYQRCLGGVIVVAEVAKNAHVYGGRGKLCIASEVEIVGIKGKFYGESLGVSRLDRYEFIKTMQYEVGDVIVFDNFRYSEGTASDGFHFYNTLKEAKGA